MLHFDNINILYLRLYFLFYQFHLSNFTNINRSKSSTHHKNIVLYVYFWAIIVVFMVMIKPIHKRVLIIKIREIINSIDWKISIFPSTICKINTAPVHAIYIFKRNIFSYFCRRDKIYKIMTHNLINLGIFINTLLIMPPWKSIFNFSVRKTILINYNTANTIFG